MESSHETLAKATAALRDFQTRDGVVTMARESRLRRVAAATKLSMMGAGAVVLIAIIWGLISPLGVGGVIVAFLAMLAAMCVGVWLSAEKPVVREDLNRVDLKALPDRTGRWLDGQRRALPAPAQKLADSIGVRLDQIAPQVAALDDKEPAAIEFRRLIADELPELVAGYQRVPVNLRREGLNGQSPDQHLSEGLAVVDTELKRMSEQLAKGDLDRLATQGRYLELKYQGEA